MQNTHDLFQKQAQDIKYPNECGMTPVAAQRPFGFFPGGRGFRNQEKTDFSGINVLVLGQDFDTEANFLAKEETPDNKTWRGVEQLLSELNIDIHQCFFSNIHMGLRKTNKNTGTCPGKTYTDYSESCKEFLKVQIETIKPNLIILLGLEPVRFFHKLFPDQTEKWKGVSSMTDLLLHKQPFLTMEIEGRKTTVLAVLHPSLNIPNRTKTFGSGNTGKEVSQLQEFLAANPL